MLKKENKLKQLEVEKKIADHRQKAELNKQVQAITNELKNMSEALKKMDKSVKKRESERKWGYLLLACLSQKTVNVFACTTCA